MEDIAIEDKYIFEYVNDRLMYFINSTVDINNARYHHCSHYEDSLSIIKNGILTLSDLHQLKIKVFSPEELKKFSVTDSHINGIDGVSLAVMGLTDLYENEEEYIPYCINNIDLIIDSRVSANRSSLHFGNEYVSHGSISNKMIRAVDIRLFEYINERLRHPEKINANEYFKIIEKYNFVREIAKEIIQLDLDTKIRENSTSSNINLDLEKLSSTPKLTLKKI